MKRSADELLDEVREVLALDKIRLETTIAFSVKGSLEGIVLSGQSQSYGERKWRKASTAIFPNEGETIADVITTLLNLRKEVRP